MLSGMWRFSPTSSWNVFSDCAVYVVLYAKLVSTLSIPSCRHPSHMTIPEPPLYVPVRGNSMVSVGWGHGIRKEETTTLVLVVGVDLTSIPQTGSTATLQTNFYLCIPNMFLYLILTSHKFTVYSLQR